MAEREGFEPPVELPPRLISSQVHSTSSATSPLAGTAALRPAHTACSVYQNSLGTSVDGMVATTAQEKAAPTLLKLSAASVTLDTKH